MIICGQIPNLGQMSEMRFLSSFWDSTWLREWGPKCGEPILQFEDVWLLPSPNFNFLNGMKECYVKHAILTGNVCF